MPNTGSAPTDALAASDCLAGLPDPQMTFADLPEEVLALALSALTEARDIASFALCSKRCAAVCRAAPLRLAVVARCDAAASPSEEQAAARAVLQALCASWPGTAELDLRGSPLQDADVEAALQALPGLTALQASGCKKLTPALTARLAAWPRLQLRAITLQRCFQLTAAALGDVLAAAAAPGSQLAAAALSHLSMEGWAERGPPPAGRLRMLALHNCAKLGSGVLQAIAVACPQLEVLMLGGSVLVVPEHGRCGGCGGSCDACTCGHAGFRPSCNGQQGEEAGCLQAAALQAVLQDGAAALVGTGFSSYVAAAVAQLAALVAKLPRLRVLELTFGLPGLAPALQRLAHTEAPLLAGRGAPLQVWDLCSAAGVAQALAWQRAVRAGAAAGHSTAPAILPADADAFLCAAVNCSSEGRQRPLHAAAEEASPALLRALLGLGAHVDARDRSGGTALFAACEAGHAGVVECLLGAGASATQRNSAGEAPLYIASLKGHGGVVDLLLRHFQERGVSWQTQRLYDGDGWTPLMAAAVGGRTSIVLKLLAAAGQEAPQLVSAANRYGQTAIHIAARKGSASLLKSLVEVGGAASLLTADAEGKTAAEIARRNGNASAMQLLMREQQRQRHRGVTPTLERPHPAQAQRWVGRRLQQRKQVSGGGGGGGVGH